MVVVSVVGRSKVGVEESVTVTVVAEEMVEVVPLITVMVKRYSLMIVLPAEHVAVVATALEDGALTVMVEPTGHVDFEAVAVTVIVEARFEAADWVTVTVFLPDAAGQVDEPATVTVVVCALAVE